MIVRKVPEWLLITLLCLAVTLAGAVLTYLAAVQILISLLAG